MLNSMKWNQFRIRIIWGMLLFLPFSAISKTPEVHIILENHLFQPSIVIIPKNTKVKLIIENKDSTAEEFDSFDLNREKVLFPGKKSVIYLSPLKPGDYHYFGEYNPNKSQGIIRILAEDRIVKGKEYPNAY